MINKVNCFGNDIYLPACDDFIQVSIKNTGGWEKKIHECYSSFLTKDSVVIEIGAHVGTHTVAMAKLCKHVYTFEIQRFLNQLLNFNVINNGCFNVTTFFEGIHNYNAVKQVEELDYTRVFNTGALTIESLHKPWGYPIMVTKIDTKFNYRFLNRLDLLKIDAEGVERDIIKSGLQTIKHFKPRILIEFDGEPDKNEMKQMLPEYQWEDIIDYHLDVPNQMMLGSYITK